MNSNLNKIPETHPFDLIFNRRLCARIFFAVLSLFLMAGAFSAHAQIKIACIGEQTTHSFHRVNDPEYPLFLGQLLDQDFKAATNEAPMGGGFIYGGGTHYRIGNFAHPQGTILDHDQTDPKSYLRSDELKLMEQFQPDIIVFGPFGDHEALSKVSMDHFKTNLVTLLDRIGSFDSKPLIYVALPLPRGGLDEDATYRRMRVEMLQVAGERKLPVIDLWTSFLGQTNYFKDATHMTEPGRRQLAKVVKDAITSTPKPGSPESRPTK
jgi:hypothetical protein